MAVVDGSAGSYHVSEVLVVFGCVGGFKLRLASPTVNSNLISVDCIGKSSERRVFGTVLLRCVDDSQSAIVG